MKLIVDRLNYDRKGRSSAAALGEFEETRTQQHMADECNINTIVKRFGLTGTVPQGLRAPTYGDFTGVWDYQSALNAIADADNVFNALPADIRKRFGNNPVEFVDFCSDEKNLDELRKMGLATPAQDVSTASQSMQSGSEAGAAGAVGNGGNSAGNAQ